MEGGGEIQMVQPHLPGKIIFYLCHYWLIDRSMCAEILAAAAAAVLLTLRGQDKCGEKKVRFSGLIYIQLRWKHNICLLLSLMNLSAPTVKLQP